ncbi:hypothetical protein ABFA25_02380 [Mycobacterium lepromatosis]
MLTGAAIAAFMVHSVSVPINHFLGATLFQRLTGGLGLWRMFSQLLRCGLGGKAQSNKATHCLLEKRDSCFSLLVSSFVAHRDERQNDVGDGSIGQRPQWSRRMYRPPQ